MRLLLVTVIWLLSILPSWAVDDLQARPGWEVHRTDKSFDTLISDLRTAAKAHKMIVVTQAGPTKAAKARGIEIPGNRVLGLFNNQFAVEILRLSTAAMIEAPVRMYVTENTDGTATLSYKRPSVIFSTYADEGGPALADAAMRLDQIFATIAADAT